MRTNRLGHSAVEVTELGFGGGPLGGLFTPLDDDTAAGALTAAWDGGIRYFDTSPHYGIGQSERRIGELLRRKPRAEFTLSTKVGRVLMPQDPDGRTDEAFEVPATHRRVWDFSRDGILRSVDDSLARMGVDRIDVLFLHDAEEHFETALHDGYPALAELRAQGTVGAIGAGMYHTGMLTRLVREAEVDVVMLAGRYTLLDHSALDDLLPACTERGVSVLAVSVFNSAVLAAPRPAAGTYFDYAPVAPERLRRAHRIADVCEAHGVTLPQVAMAFPLCHPAVAGIAVGMRSAAEVRRNLELFGTEIPAQVWADLRHENLLDERAPVSPGRLRTREQSGDGRPRCQQPDIGRRKHRILRPWFL
jgi:D-threo-aldose 1-dehydrogenase